MEKIWADMYAAAKGVLAPREVSRFVEAGGVAAAIESASGKIYVGVCVHIGRVRRAQCAIQHDNEWRRCVPPRYCHQFKGKGHTALRRMQGTDEPAYAR